MAKGGEPSLKDLERMMANLATNLQSKVHYALLTETQHGCLPPQNGVE